MLKRTLILLALLLAQTSCGFEYGDRYEVASLGDGRRQNLEREKRELLQIENLKIGTGPVAAWGRKISAHIEVRYADGTRVFEGATYTLVGFERFPETSLDDNWHLNNGQPGIKLGLNGMAVGGKRRITIDRKVVCDDLREDANPQATCLLLGRSSVKGTLVAKEKLIVEATLTESCIPVRVKAFFWRVGINKDIYCRTIETPKLDPAAPLWRFYADPHI
jgi:hypothetical protein